MTDRSPHGESSNLSRRKFVLAAGSAGLAAMSIRPQTALGAWLKETPPQFAGPFYAKFKPLSIDNDLVLLPGKTEPAQGKILHVLGRVLDQRGHPLEGARVEIWQANAFGRYNHPRHTHSKSPLDPHFQGFGHDAADQKGYYRFRTIKPGAYADSPTWTRPPHIHFAVYPPRGEPWTTQMYFQGEELNKTDFLLNDIAPEDRPLVVMPILPPEGENEPDSGQIVFDIVLGQPGVERKPA